MHMPFHTARRRARTATLRDESLTYDRLQFGQPRNPGRPARREKQMPVYEYRCPDCVLTYEQLVRLSEPSDQAPCPKCGGRGKKLLSVFASPSRGSSEAADPAGSGGGGGGCCGGGCCAG